MSNCTNGISNSAGDYIYPPIAVNDVGIKTRAQEIVDFFKGKGLPIEIGIAVAGVWAAESGIKNWIYNSAEQSNGYAFRGKHSPVDDKYKFKYGGQVYEKTEETMRAFGYGKGLAQWSWSRNFKFRDWYNGKKSGYVGTEGLESIDQNASAITATSVSTQTAFAWVEMQERTGEFMTAINEISGSPATNKEEFRKNVTKAVDAVLRGFENGNIKKMASTSAIDKYTWDGGYSGAMKKRVGRALGLAESLKDTYPELNILI